MIGISPEDTGTLRWGTPEAALKVMEYQRRLQTRGVLMAYLNAAAEMWEDPASRNQLATNRLAYNDSPVVATISTGYNGRFRDVCLTKVNLATGQHEVATGPELYADASVYVADDWGEEDPSEFFTPPQVRLVVGQALELERRGLIVVQHVPEVSKLTA